MRHLVILGPTASGKTKHAIAIAKAFNTEIINVDSRQIYKGLDIGSAKPTIKEQEGIKHYFLDSLSLDETYSAGEFGKDARDILNTAKKPLVISGGSFFYMKALLSGLDDFPKVDPAIRDSLNDEYQKKGIEYLQKRLSELDSECYKAIDQNNPRRLIRALEVCIGSGRTFSSFKSKKRTPIVNTFNIALDIERDVLYERINSRVDYMLENGLLDEVKGLIKYESKSALQTVGYQELFPYFRNEYSLKEATRLIKRNTRRFAKRQSTFLRSMDNINWVNYDDNKAILKMAENQVFSDQS